MTHVHALVLAALLATPLLLLWLQRGRDTNAGLPPMVVWICDRYLWVVAAGFVWFEGRLLSIGLQPHHVVESTTLLVAVTACAVVAARYPLMGVLGFGLINATFGRDDTVTRTFVDLGATSWMAFLCVLALLTWLRRHDRPLVLARGFLPWTAALFFAWMGLAIVAAVAAGRPVTDDVTWRAARNVQCAALFLVAANYTIGLRELRVLLTVFGLALVLRQTLLTSYWLFEQNLAMLAVVTAPVSLALAFARPWDLLQVPLAATSIYLGGMILFVRNRGAVVGLAAAVLGLWPLARRRWLMLPVLLTIPVAIGLWANQAGLLSRFYTIYVDGHFLGSAAERVMVWTNGLAMGQSAWLFGVGPGNFEWAINAYTGGAVWLSAHNSYVELFVEAGLPALVLYLSVFVAALVTLAGVSRTFKTDWRRTAAAGILGSLAAHLAAGTFLSNPSLGWTWMLLGLGVSLRHDGAPAMKSHAQLDA